MANYKLLINEVYIEIQGEYSPLVDQIPYVHHNRKHTVFRTTTRNIELVLKLLRGIDSRNIEMAPPKVQQIYNAEKQRRIDTESLIALGPKNQDEWKFRSRQFLHQQLGREIAAINPRFAFFYDTRTGKTPMGLQIIADDIAKYPTHKWLVLCPLILIENAWLEDAHKFFPNISVVNLHDTSKSARLAKFRLDANIYISNIESFVSYREYIEMLPIQGCIVDESSTMKSQKSKFGKAAVEYSNKLRRWYLLSGSPAPNGEWEYYRQLQSIDYYGVHPSWTQFKNYFFNNISYNPQFEKLQIKPEKKDELIKLLKRYSLYVDKEDVLITPGRRFEEVIFDMPVELTRQYHELRRKMYLELPDEALITAASAMGKLNKLNQVSSGFIIDTRTQATYLLDHFRFKKLYELLDSFGNEQVLIWANYIKEFEVIQRHLGDKCGCVYGKTNLATKNDNIKKFKMGAIQYLVANPASADKGLTLTNTCKAIYFSMNYSYELFKQSMDRIYGDISSQKYECVYYVLIANGTVDRVIYDAVKNKGSMSAAVLSHLKGGEHNSHQDSKS